MDSRNIRLFLVEDNPSDVWLLREALRLAQFPAHLTVSRDGLEATRYLRQMEAEPTHCPDLVLLDLNLPRRNGREVLADMKRSPALQAIPVIVLSSSSADEDRRQADQLHATGFLTKPNNLPAYVEMVRSLAHFWSGHLDVPSIVEHPPGSALCANG